MERRISSFLIASSAFFLIYISLRIMFVPPRPVAEPPRQPDIADVAGEAVAEKDGDADVQPDAVPEGDEETIDRPGSPTWSTLGSMDADSGHVMLMTLNSRGAGIERIELTERKPNGRLKYRRVDVRSGYLGYLASDPESTETGVRVNVVGPGTPAATAVSQVPNVADGLKVGDLIVGLDDAEIANSQMLADALNQTEPGDSVRLEVIRGEGDSAMTINFAAALTEHPLDLVRLSNRGGEDEIRGNLPRLSSLMTVSRVGRKEILPDQQTILGGSDPAALNWNQVDDAAPGEADTDDAKVAEAERNQDDDGDASSISYRVRLSGAEMARVGGGALAMRRTYTIRPGSYLIDMRVALENQSEQMQPLAYRLEGVNGVTLEGWWYSNKISPNWGGSAARDVVYRTAAEGHELVSGYGILKQARKDSATNHQVLFAPDSPAAAKQLDYVGVDAQYFTVAYLPPADEQDSFRNAFRRVAATIVADAREVPNNQERAVNTSFFLDSNLVDVPAGGSIEQELRLFAGPKQPDLLATVGLDECIYYGWFSLPARWLGHLLHALSAVGNYAVAIILLTVIVRGVMFPLSRKAAVNAQRMQELAPELKKITEKYKDDMEGRIRAQRDLQKRVGFNPMAGCLPMFLQLPIFIGLYRTLSVDIELRQAAFASWTSWASNLAAPDMLTYWGDWLWGYLSGRGTG
ncbi:MAG: YidC/Oxa1 family insertase periplasmic-domain containing protein, partial [Planctomycetota bacterium]